MKAMEFTVTHVIPATPQELSDAWLDGDSPRGPWLGDGARRIDPVVGGAYYWVDLEGEKSPPHYGRFLRIERPRLIEYTFVSKFTHGLDSIVTVEFASTGGQTEVTLRHSGLPDGKDGLDHKKAWIGILANVGAHFSASPISAR